MTDETDNPDALVLDEDATPLARAAVTLARRHRAASFVVRASLPLRTKP